MRGGQNDESNKDGQKERERKKNREGKEKELIERYGRAEEWWEDEREERGTDRKEKIIREERRTEG